MLIRFLILVGLNFGVLIAWSAISSVTMPLAQWYVRRQDIIVERKRDIPVMQELKLGPDASI